MMMHLDVCGIAQWQDDMVWPSQVDLEVSERGATMVGFNWYGNG